MGKQRLCGLSETSLRALIDNPAVDNIIIPAGVIMLTRPIIGRDNLTIRGSGRNATFLVAAPNFQYASPYNGVIAALGAVGFSVSDLTADGNKVGWDPVRREFTTRLCGIIHRNCKDYDVERVSTKDITGYAFFPCGEANTAAQTQYMTEHGRYRDLKAKNSNVHFESMRCNDILLDGMTYDAGDADWPCEGAVHPLVFGKRHTYRRVHGTGGYASIAIVASGGEFDNLVFDDMHHVATTRSAAVIVSAQSNPIKNVRIHNSHFEAQNGNGTDIEGGDFSVSNTTFIGSHPTNPSAALVIGGECRMRCTNVLAEGRSFSPNQWSYGLVNQNMVTPPNNEPARPIYFDGELRTVAKPLAYGSPTGSSLITMSPNTTQRALVG